MDSYHEAEALRHGDIIFSFIHVNDGQCSVCKRNTSTNVQYIFDGEIWSAKREMCIVCAIKLHTSIGDAFIDHVSNNREEFTLYVLNKLSFKELPFVTKTCGKCARPVHIVDKPRVRANWTRATCFSYCVATDDAECKLACNSKNTGARAADAPLRGILRKTSSYILDLNCVPIKMDRD